MKRRNWSANIPEADTGCRKGTGGVGLELAMFATAADRRVLAGQIERLVGTGSVPIALYGAGRVAAMLRHGVRVGEGPGRHDEHLVGIIDDDPRRAGETWAGLEVLTLDQAVNRGIKAVIITAEGAMQDAIWAKRGPLIERGIRVLTCPQRFAGQSWDDCLVDHYEQGVAAERGIARPYAREYPAKDDVPLPAIHGAIASRMFDGAVVCEIGSGSGKWTSLFIEQAGQYHCVDYSARLLHEVIEHRFHKHRAKLHLHHDERARLEGVPDASVDLVFSVDVFVHFKMDLVHQFLASIRRVLKPEGRALLHFAAWNRAQIERWRMHDTAHHDGGTGPIHCVHMDWLVESGRDVGLNVKQIGGDLGWAFLAEFTRR